MPREEGLPGRLRAALRYRLDAMVLEDRLNRVAGDVVADALQPATDPRVPPGRVLGRHAHDERGDLRFGARATGASRLRAVVFLRHEPAIPPQDGVRGDDAGDGRQTAAANHVAFHGEAATLVVGEAHSSG